MPGKASRENGKKGGRPMSASRVEREHLKTYIAERIAEEGPKIVSALMKKAIKGDVMAIRELFDRGFGRPSQEVAVTGKDGKDLFMPSERIERLAFLLNEAYKRGLEVGELQSGGDSASNGAVANLMGPAEQHKE